MRSKLVRERPPRDPAIRPRADEVEVPLVGRIAVGVPILAEEMIEDTFWLPRKMVGAGTLFMLKVTRDSMTGGSIYDGDIVIVRQQPVAENGEIVAAAVIDGLEAEATVKTLRGRAATFGWCRTTLPCRFWATRQPFSARWLRQHATGTFAVTSAYRRPSGYPRVTERTWLVVIDPRFAGRLGRRRLRPPRRAASRSTAASGWPSARHYRPAMCYPG